MANNSNVPATAALQNTGLRMCVFTSIPQEVEFRQQWNALVLAMESPEVFYTWEWAQAVYQAYSADLLLLAAFREDVLAGIVALKVHGDCASFLAANTADYCDFVCKPQDQAEFLQTVFAELRKRNIRKLQLGNLPADSSSVAALRISARCHGFRLFRRSAYFCPQILLSPDSARAATRDSAARRRRRTGKQLSAHGTLAVQHQRNAHALAAMPDFFAAHVARFFSQNRLSNLISTERQAFLKRLGELLSEQRWLAFSTVQVNGNSVAWNYGMIFAGKWFWYQPAFDIAWQESAPGTHLLNEIIHEAASNPEIHTIDMGLGDESYKQRYTTAGRRTLHVTANTSAARSAWTIARHGTAALLKKSPAAEKLARRSLLMLSGLREQIRDNGIRGLIDLGKRNLVWRRETAFFEWAPSGTPCSYLPAPGEGDLQPLSFALLARAAMAHEKDAETAPYLLRCSIRLKSGQAQAFALVDRDGHPVHFCWTKSFEQCWIAGVEHKVQSPEPGSVLIFDCWTPASLRGRGYYQSCIARVASNLLQSGAKPWIFTDPGNVSSFRGIVSAGFVPRFLLSKRKTLFFSRVSRVDFDRNTNTPLLGSATAA